VNGSTFMEDQRVYPNTGNTAFCVTTFPLYNATAGDIITVKVFQNTGSSQTLSLVANVNRHSSIEIQYIGT
jgi:hypothetical protein